LPNADRAVIDDAKLRDYALNLAHKHGRNKAKLFHRLLGLSLADWPFLKAAILNAAQTEEAAPVRRNAFGQIYRVDFACVGPGGTAVLRSGWIVRDDEDFPRLVTCYPLE